MSSSAGTYRRLFSYIAPFKGLFGLAFLATLLFAATDTFSIIMLVPFLHVIFSSDDNTPMPVQQLPGDLGVLLDKTVGQLVTADMPQAQALGRVTILIVVVFLIKNIFDYLQSILVVKLEQSVVRNTRTQVYRHLLELDLRFFNRTRAGDIIRRLTADVDQVRLLVTNNFFKLLTATLQVILAVAFMVKLNIQLTFIALVVLPLMFGLLSRLLKRLKRGDRGVMELASDITSHLQETVFGVRQVKAAAAERFEAERFDGLTHRYMKAHVRTERVRALANPMSELMGTIGTVILLWFGARMVQEKEIAAAGFLAFLVLSIKLYQPAKWLSKFPSIINPGIVSAERVFEFLDTPAGMVDAKGATTFTGVKNEIRFENVSFHYTEGEAVLDDVSFAVKPGQVVALVGPSGAGKTTLVDLVARFYDPTAGRVTVDGVDLREFNVKTYRARLGIVTQETVLFHDTVRSNIGYALGDVDHASIETAASAANASEFIDRLPAGYDTVLGERATRLSGGQRQRLAIARAILRDPPVLIFDEATSALDSESERLVQDAIEHLLQGRTVFVIAHRLSTIRHADLILVMDAGRIVQRGTHDELLAEGGLYGKLHGLQFSERPALVDDDAALVADPADPATLTARASAE